MEYLGTTRPKPLDFRVRGTYDENKKLVVININGKDIKWHREGLNHVRIRLAAIRVWLDDIRHQIKCFLLQGSFVLRTRWEIECVLEVQVNRIQKIVDIDELTLDLPEDVEKDSTLKAMIDGLKNDLVTIQRDSTLNEVQTAARGFPESPERPSMGIPRASSRELLVSLIVFARTNDTPAHELWEEIVRTLQARLVTELELIRPFLGCRGNRTKRQRSFWSVTIVYCFTCGITGATNSRLQDFYPEIQECLSHMWSARVPKSWLLKRYHDLYEAMKKRAAAGKQPEKPPADVSMANHLTQAFDIDLKPLAMCRVCKELRGNTELLTLKPTSTIYPACSCAECVCTFCCRSIDSCLLGPAESLEKGGAELVERLRELQKLRFNI
ncbi:hypothetical protein BDV96DRAFT_604473 [Lophiotrema nucula]|uniref:Uncharacterized protein n=1 Tax=Lophiotrema nucula TaxID=690887 RepID=A0A6A5YSP6_9PLEO|nr:hypothetical protein BDV96DRAFT_604473 [Lophiotrema nucula]